MRTKHKNRRVSSCNIKKENNMKLTPKELTQARHAAAAKKAYRAMEAKLEQREVWAFGSEQRSDDSELDSAIGGSLQGRGRMSQRYTMDNQ